jgi:transmembrane sensor
MNLTTPSSEILKKYLANTCSDQERTLVDSWYYNLNLETDSLFSPIDEAKLYQQIQYQILEEQAHRTNQTRILKFSGTFLRAAAALIILTLGFVYFFNSDFRKKSAMKTSAENRWLTYTNDQKKMVRYVFPDKSIAWLQPGAVLSHPSFFKTNKNREIHFQGEGFFNITHDKEHPFIVYCGKLKTQVLGTTFNVNANLNESTYKVSVVTGSVAISTPDSDHQINTVVLKPKQQGVYEKSKQSLTINTLSSLGLNKENWQPVSLTFNETPMKEVAQRLQSTFKIKIEFANKNIEKCRLKVDFNNQQLPEILEMIDVLLGTTYEMEGSTITLKGEGCSGK